MTHRAHYLHPHTSLTTSLPNRLFVLQAFYKARDTHFINLQAESSQTNVIAKREKFVL